VCFTSSFLSFWLCLEFALQKSSFVACWLMTIFAYVVIMAGFFAAFSKGTPQVRL
jgi:hypothetical protein